MKLIVIYTLIIFTFIQCVNAQFAGNFSQLNYLNKKDLKNINPQVLVENNNVIAVYIDTLILDHETLTNLSKQLPKHLAIIANKIIILGYSTIDISGDKTANDELNKSGGTVVFIANELFFDNEGGLTVNVSGAKKDFSITTNCKLPLNGLFNYRLFS